MKKIVLATSNKYKVNEFKNMLGGYDVLSLSDIGFFEEIMEDGKTMKDNSIIKATTVLKFCQKNNIKADVIADDSGLCVNSLNGAPGVNSARYAGNHDDEANRQKLFKELNNISDRTAYFECALCYASNDVIKVFEGRTYGVITDKKIGDESFGYDCVFYSTDLNKTFGEVTKEEKDRVSHRGRAVELLKQWITENKS